MHKIVVLGAGLVGKAIAIDLSSDFEVTAVDINESALNQLEKNYPIKTVSADVTQPGVVEQLVSDFDLVVEAVPGFMGYATLEKIIRAGKDVVDISFFPEDALQLDALAKEQNVTAIVDCGVAPGMSNLILGHHNATMEVSSFACYVGGLPKVRTLPFEYKAPFSPIDVIEEYTRPARLKEKGEIVTRPAMSEIEALEFENIGTLEAFNTDGLRSLLKTVDVPNMKEKTLRYPGHIEKIRFLRDAGFFSELPVQTSTGELSPLEMTAKVLIPAWELEPGEREFTVMRIVIQGTQGGKAEQVQWDMYDEYDVDSETSSMARTTGYTATAAARLILEDGFVHKGICPPEFIGADEGWFNKMLGYLRDRNIHYHKTVTAG